MQVKQIYLDLREGPQYAKKNGNVWLLESEAFKEPLQFGFEFDSADIRSLEEIKKECQVYLDKIKQKEKEIGDRIHELDLKLDVITKSYQKIEELKEKYEKLLDQSRNNEVKIIKKGIEDNDKIEGIQLQINDLRKEISLPELEKIYTHTWEEFVTGCDLYYGKQIKLPVGDYCIIEQYEYEPQNEYVMNQNKIKIKQQHLSGGYVPEIQLESSNAIDKPVSKVRLTVLFFQR